MKPYIIICRLSYTENYYTNLNSYFKTAPGWAHPFAGIWIIKTTATGASIRDGVKSRIYPADGVIVMELTHPNDWATFNIPKNISDWLKADL